MFISLNQSFNSSENILYGELGFRLIVPIKIIALISARFKTLVLGFDKEVMLLSITSIPLLTFLSSASNQSGNLVCSSLLFSILKSRRESIISSTKAFIFKQLIFFLFSSGIIGVSFPILSS